MAVTASRLKRISASARFDGSGDYFTATWTVTSNDPDDQAVSIYTGARSSSPDPIPARFAAFSIGNDTNNSSVLDSVSLRRSSEDRILEWEVVGEFKPVSIAGYSPGTWTADPLLRPVLYRIESNVVSKEVLKATLISPTMANSGWAVGAEQVMVNAAGAKFGDPVYDEDSTLVLVATKNYSTLGAIETIHRTYRNTLNSDTFHGYAAGHCKFLSVESSDIRSENGQDYYSAIIRIEFGNKEFYHEIANVGLKDKDGKIPVDADGKDIIEPVKLDANGVVLADNAATVFITARSRSLVAYAGLGI